MKKTFYQIAQGFMSSHVLSELDCRTILSWFKNSSLYFSTDDEKKKALDAFTWMYSHTSTNDGMYFDHEAENRCAAAFSEQFSLPVDHAERLLTDFARHARTAGPVIIGIEGLDGSGKTVQAMKLYHVLEQKGKKTCVIDFPQYSSFFGKEIGALLSDTGTVSAMDLDEKSMCLWYGLDRWKAVSHAQIEQYDYVIFNRYTLSNVVYQTARRYGGFNQEFADWIFEFEHTQLALPVPDVYIYLNTKSEFCGENVLRKGEREYTSGLDVYEKSQALLSCCHSIYQKLADEIDEIRFIECVDDKGALRNIDEITADITVDLEKYGLLI